MPSPSYKGFAAASRASSKAKQANSKTDTKPELILRRHLWGCGYRFRKHAASLPGKPDIVFSQARVAVFCDGDFWHGRHWQTLEAQLARRANPEYWIPKIQTNMDRDRVHSAALAQMGWTVFRVWEGEIKRDVAAAAAPIAALLETARRSSLSAEGAR
jgi:DNA mismatch endonuclease (patch repair protein)